MFKQSTMPTVLIAGGTGLVGKRLTQLLLERNYSVIILSRTRCETNSVTPRLSFALWDVENGKIDIHALQKVDYIINLAGANVAGKRWNDAYKKQMLESRTNSGKLIATALAENENKVEAVICASAIGWYGKDNEKTLLEGFHEDAPPANDFFGNTCKLWEQSTQTITTLNKRLVYLRIGIVLDKNSGAFAEFAKPLRTHIAAIFGNGKQILSWIHIDDLCNMFIYAIEHKHVLNAYNAVAPFPVSNKKFLKVMAAQFKSKHFLFIHIPAFLLKIILGEFANELLKSTTVSADKIRKDGFQFLYPDIETAVKDLYCGK